MDGGRREPTRLRPSAKQAELLSTAHRLLDLYIALYPQYAEAMRAGKLLTGKGMRIVGGHERGRYVVRDDAGSEIITLDLRSWIAARENV